MKYKLVSADNGNKWIALESSLNEAERQANYYLRKADDVSAIDIIELESGAMVERIGRNI